MAGQPSINRIVLSRVAPHRCEQACKLGTLWFEQSSSMVGGHLELLQRRNPTSTKLGCAGRSQLPVNGPPGSYRSVKLLNGLPAEAPQAASEEDVCLD